MTTILILISRPQWLDKIFATLENLDCKPMDTNILGIVDGDTSLYVTARNKIEASKFNSRLCVQYKTKDKLLNANIAHRQQRISNIHEFAKQYLDTEYIFGIEDDSTFSVTAMKQLQHDYAVIPYAGIISGVQIGRHGINHIGAWKTDNIYNPREITSIEKSEGVKHVDATGFYCFMTKAENYLKHEFKPFELTLGPDFNYGMKMRQLGLMNYVDFKIPVSHHTKDGEITLSNTEVETVTFIKSDSRWRQKTHG